MPVLVFAINLGLTILVEGGIIALLFRRFHFVYVSFLCNLLTNPLVNLLLLLAVRLLGEGAYTPSTAVLEIAAVIAEACIYRMLAGFSAWKSIGVSFLLNAASYGAGLAFYALAGPLFA